MGNCQRKNSSLDFEYVDSDKFNSPKIRLVRDKKGIMRTPANMCFMTTLRSTEIGNRSA